VPINILLFGEGILSTIKMPFEVYTEKILNMENLKAFGYIIYLKIKGIKPGKSFLQYRPRFIFIKIKGLLIWKLLKLFT
jgi:hypothetical protein